jgi:hypothetical protein
LLGLQSPSESQHSENPEDQEIQFYFIFGMGYLYMILRVSSLPKLSFDLHGLQKKTVLEDRKTAKEFLSTCKCSPILAAVCPTLETRASSPLKLLYKLSIPSSSCTKHTNWVQ